MFGIDVQRVTAALRREVGEATELDITRLADVLGALAEVSPGPVPGVAERDGAPIPPEVRQRMLFACAIIFSGGALETVTAFVVRNLEPAGLLRLRPAPRATDVEMRALPKRSLSHPR